MNNWLKGLLVAVGSAIVTTIAAVLAVPGQFSFTKAGLTKLAIIVVPVAAKVVWAYFQNPGGTPAPVVQIASQLKGPAPKIIVLGFLALSACAHAQTPAPLPTTFYGAGAAYNNNSGSDSPVAVSAFVAHKALTDTTYPFVWYDAVPNKGKPFQINSNVAIGAAQKLFSFKAGEYTYSVLGVAGAGPSWQGPNLSWGWKTGFTVPVKVAKNFWVLPNIRTQSSGVSAGSGIQLIVGLDFAIGQ